MDIFSDATPCEGEPVNIQHLPPKNDWVARGAQRAPTDKTSVHYNPSAGQVHNRERGKPWKRYWEKRVANDEEKALGEIREKRLWNMAKQVCTGLEHSLGIVHGVAEMKNYLQLASEQIERG